MRRAWLLAALLVVGCKQPDHVYDENGVELSCPGVSWDRCVAMHCANGYEVIQWRDLGGSGTYRCKRKDAP